MSCFSLDDHDRAQALAVDDECGPRVARSDEPDVAARQADERVGSGDGEAAAAWTAGRPVTGAVPPCWEPAPVGDEMSTTLAPAGGATWTSLSGTAPNEMSVAFSSSAGEEAPCA